MELMTCAQTLARHEGSVTCLLAFRGTIFSAGVDSTLKVSLLGFSFHQLESSHGIILCTLVLVTLYARITQLILSLHYAFQSIDSELFLYNGFKPRFPFHLYDLSDCV